MVLTSWIETLIVAAICAVSCRHYLHMLQLESYQIDGYQRWIQKNREILFGWTLNIGVLATILKFLLGMMLTMLLGELWGNVLNTIVVLGAFGFAAFELMRKQLSTPEKKPLVFTPRMKRLCAALGLCALVFTAMINALGLPPYILYCALAYLVMAAAAVMQPVERAINDHFLNDARSKLAGRDDLIKIGITGSYGKTSTKFILQTILAERYDVLATPSSFNTPMGLTRVIREQLEPHHQVFLAEMGARHVGDIRELVSLVKPQYGVLTSVGAQHLETFGNIETVAKTKNELIEGLPRDGVAFFAADAGWVDRLYEQCKLEKYRSGLSGGFLSMYAEDVQVGNDGSRFILCDAEGGRAACHTRMLGRHNIENIVLCCMVAKRLGLSLEQIARGVGKTQPVEHRLQLIENPGGMTIIDDAFNSNPVGAQAALDVLRAFPGRRILVTPGMVEQGAEEEELNKRFGGQITGSCDVLILVGVKRTRPIAQGALATGFDENALYPVEDIQQATALLAKIGRAGDVVLFENDLPDNYS